MPYKNDDEYSKCLVCESAANRRPDVAGFRYLMDCSRCGDFAAERSAMDDFSSGTPSANKRALASHLIRRMQGGKRPEIGSQFFLDLRNRELPTPAEQVDNAILYLAAKADGRPGAVVNLDYQSPEVEAIIGVVNKYDLEWVGGVLSEKLIRPDSRIPLLIGRLTAEGWRHVEALKHAQVVSRYSFFARQFDNRELDELFERCLQPAVKQTGFELVELHKWQDSLMR